MLKKKEADQPKKAEKTNVSKTKKDKKGKKPNIFVRFGKFLKDVWAELKKVTWPTRKDFLSYSGMVLVFIALMALVTFGIDTGITALLRLVVG